MFVPYPLLRAELFLIGTVVGYVTAKCKQWCDTRRCKNYEPEKTESTTDDQSSENDQ